MNRSVVRIEVRNNDANLRKHVVAENARKFLNIPITGAEHSDVYWIASRENVHIPRDELEVWAKEVFSDFVIQRYCFNPEDFTLAAPDSVSPSFSIETRFRPGVTDNVGNSATEALRLFSQFARENDVRVYSGKMTFLYGNVTKLQAEQIGSELLGNPLLQQIKVESWRKTKNGVRFSQESVPEVSLTNTPEANEIHLHLDDAKLMQMNRDNCWALSLEELKLIRDYFDRADVQSARKKEGLGIHPTDVEVEILAQSWSEHCKHKIFASDIDYREEVEEENKEANSPLLGNQKIQSIFKTYIAGATKKVKADRNLDWLVSVFTDNAGIVRFDDKLDLCIKVETHNSPSALDPYGGSLTGIVGVNRDILGCGMGARPIANTDVFCFAPPDWPEAGSEKELPEGLKHPRRIMEGVHLGVEHGGNKSGIPTVNGSFVFHKNFAGKPLVFCGTIGALPPKLKSGRLTADKGQKPNDRVFMAGGRIGKDGIHGATFSSMELNSDAPVTAVQIGDPITQKRLSDFLIEARDLELFSSLTDNGAGGLSSSVGEMAELCNGATIDVAKAPVKYPGLSPFELVISESQERMTFSVPEDKKDAFEQLAQKRGVEVSDIGEFTSDGFFRVQYEGKTVALLDLDFLHNGLPPMKLNAKWTGPRADVKWTKEKKGLAITERKMNAREFYEEALLKILGSWNVCSKEDLVRRYDHEVQAATVVKPFVGVNSAGPSDAGVIWLAPHGGEELTGISIGCGLMPKFSRYDTYQMAQYSLDEAMRNCVAVGADPDMVAMIDNFCWPDPIHTKKNSDGDYKLAQLVRACKGLYDLAEFYGTPFVSGKDSMKNDFIGFNHMGKEIKISVPPTLLVTAMAKVPDVSKTITSDFKKSGDKVYLLGKNQPALGGSELTDIFDLPENSFKDKLPELDKEAAMQLYRNIFTASQKNLLNSCHDCSEGGMLTALAESAIGGELGVRVELENCSASLEKFDGSVLEFFFNESPARFIVSCSPENEKAFLEHFSDCELANLGDVDSHKNLRITKVGMVIVDAELSEMSRHWQKGMQ